MKRLLLGTALVTAFFAVAVPAAASPLAMGTARQEANLAAFEFATRHDLDESNVGRCRRSSAAVVSCAGTAKGETFAATKSCELRIVVRGVEHHYFTDVVDAITHHHCTTTPKERLTASAAAPAIQAKADAFAGTKTEISSLYRVDEVTYSATARWQRPAVRASEFIQTESCSVSLIANLADGHVSVETEGFACY
jgi:hypothetical protein